LFSRGDDATPAGAAAATDGGAADARHPRRVVDGARPRLRPDVDRDDDHHLGGLDAAVRQSTDGERDVDDDLDGAAVDRHHHHHDDGDHEQRRTGHVDGGVGGDVECGQCPTDVPQTRGQRHHGNQDQFQ
jgi:hypothetical protein